MHINFHFLHSVSVTYSNNNMTRTLTTPTNPIKIKVFLFCLHLKYFKCFIYYKRQHNLPFINNSWILTIYFNWCFKGLQSCHIHEIPSQNWRQIEIVEIDSYEYRNPRFIHKNIFIVILIFYFHHFYIQWQLNIRESVSQTVAHILCKC